MKRCISAVLVLVMLFGLLPHKILISNAASNNEDIKQTTETTANNVELPAYEAIRLDFGKIPMEFNNKTRIELEPMLFSNLYFTQETQGYNSNTEMLYLSSGILRLAVYWEQHLYINDYSSDYMLLESRDIPLDVSDWGGICLGEESSFIFYGQSNTEEDTNVYSVTKFDAEFDETATISLNDYTMETLDLLAFSNVAMGICNHTLTIFTERMNRGYSCPLSIEIDTQKMETSDASNVVTFQWKRFMGSDTYRNLLGFDGNESIFATADASDYPGGVYVRVGNSVTHLKPDTALGDNEFIEDPILTDATNMAVSSSHYLIATAFENYGVNNIYLAVQEKGTGKISGSFLTNATAFNSEINGNPWIVDLGMDRFGLFWERIELGMVNVCSVLLDASGMPMGQIQTWRGCSLSSMVPICANGCVLWTTAENGEIVLHQLSDLDESGYQELDSGIVEGGIVWNGTTDSSWYQESETYFSISTAEQLAGLAMLVNVGNDFAGKTVRLENDLFMNSTPFGHIEGNQWIPIGASEDGTAVFNGTFDGQCHTIYNMLVPAEGLTGGVFGTIGVDGTVKCLTLEQGWFGSSACVADTNYGNVLFCMAKSYVDSPDFGDPRGGVCTYNYGLIYGCQNYGFIEHSSECGGIVYQNEQSGTISQCANKGLLYTYGNTFTGTGTSGIAYDSYGWIYNCYNLGVAMNGSNRSAGIVGYTNGYIGCGQIYNCYSLSGYPLRDPIYISKGDSARVENCFGNTEPGAEWYEAFCEPEFLTKLDEQLGPMASAWLPDTLGINNGLPIPVAEYNYHTGNYKVQPELWGVYPSVTVNLSEKDTISLSNVEFYFSDASLEITSDNLNVAEVIGREIHLKKPGTANILFHLDETEESTALDYTIVITVEGEIIDESVQEIRLNNSMLSLEIGETAELIATVSPENAANKTVIWSSTDTNVATVNEYGLVTAVANGTATIMATAQDGSNVNASCVVTVQQPVTTPNNFEDVVSGSYYEQPVQWAVENGITNGYGSDTIFNPEGTCTRGQIVTFLWRANGSPEPASLENPFTDVPRSEYYYKAVLWAVENGITAGYGSDTIFNPDGACNRAQVATFMWRAAGKPDMSGAVNPFTDLDTEGFYYDAVLWAVENGITNGYGSADTFCPDITCTRGQIVTFLYRAMN